jgi:NADH-quinone oxidoreductase subunit B
MNETLLDKPDLDAAPETAPACCDKPEATPTRQPLAMPNEGRLGRPYVSIAPDGSRSHAPIEPACFLGEEEMPSPLSLNEAMGKIKNWVRANSLNVLAYGTACGAIEMRPLGTSRFDMERFGITMAPTSRQSNVLVISGYLSIKTLKRVIRAYEQMPSPKWTLGLGSCTIDGGMYWDSYNTVKQVDLYLPIDVYIAGCMPRPEALIAGFQALMNKIKLGKANGWNEYLQNLESYKANQRKVITDWGMPAYNW